MVVQLGRRRRAVRGGTVGLVLAATMGSLGCSSGVAGPRYACVAGQMYAEFDGTLQTPTGTVQLMVKDSMASYYIAQFLFDDIKSVLIDGQPLLGESVLWNITEGGTGTTLAFRMGGVRSVGARLPIPGAFTMAPGWRMDGLISPVIPSSVLMFFTYMGSRATEASGELIVTSAAPLRGNLSVNLGLDSGVDVHLAGQLRLSYAALPPGCEEG
jgi:hypothetical protein